MPISWEAPRPINTAVAEALSNLVWNQLGKSYADRSFKDPVQKLNEEMATDPDVIAWFAWVRDEAAKALLYNRKYPDGKPFTEYHCHKYPVCDYKSRRKVDVLNHHRQAHRRNWKPKKVKGHMFKGWMPSLMFFIDPNDPRSRERIMERLQYFKDHEPNKIKRAAKNLKSLVGFMTYAYRKGELR